MVNEFLLNAGKNIFQIKIVKVVVVLCKGC